MKKYLKVMLILLCSFYLSAEEKAQAEDKPLLIAHFMPWYVAPPIESNWGWHWTMNFFNPNNIDENGKREIASHYYPLTGPYDSMHPDIMEYQVLLMKLSGIDGIVVDWYGTGTLWDYPGINDRTTAMFEYIEKANLLFSICYEDQTLPNLISQGIITDDEKYAQGKQDILYLQDTWFTKDAHLKIENQPVLLNFGPQYFKNSSEWEDIFSVLSMPPLFFTEDNRIAPAAVGAFSWPPMSRAPADGELTQTSLKQYLNDFSSKSRSWPYRISSAFPGFNDIYKQAGVSNGYAFLDADNGSTFQLTLDQALSDDPHIIQLVTWNDYGEGTIIEPTEEFGYLYLEMIQGFRRKNIDPAFQPQTGHLRMPLQIYQARQDYPNDAQLNMTLDQVFALFVDMQLDAAYELLKTVVKVEEPQQDSQPATFALRQNYPNPFNPATTIELFLPAKAFVNLEILNTLGQTEETLVTKVLGEGSHSYIWNAGERPSGVYLVRLTTGDFSQTRKMLLVR
ncbi:T9SS C-terminal target domain-containing protein [candidate division KSB1 bacterium]|nr:T9SS type A sorting domain-containing protein [candidate division KSB1 bacterium]RQW05046.1 MAG: T9SS C-terminal target domain-containing protein [candidate division KSB1 bacterium]